MEIASGTAATTEEGGSCSSSPWLPSPFLFSSTEAEVPIDLHHDAGGEYLDYLTVLEPEAGASS